MNVINIADYKNGEKQWDGKLKQGPTLFQIQRLVSEKEISISNGQYLEYVEKHILHELVEFLFKNKVMKVTYEALPLGPFEETERACRKINASIMLFTGASNAKL